MRGKNLRGNRPSGEWYRVNHKTRQMTPARGPGSVAGKHEEILHREDLAFQLWCEDPAFRMLEDET
jgi:hypothetical protein